MGLVTPDEDHLPDFPYTSQCLALGEVELRYLDEGPKDAEPIVMVHGNPTWSFYFRRLVGELCGRYRTIVPDHIGMGRSTKPKESQYEFTLSRRVSDLEALIESLHLQRKITLVLHDWGGMIGMSYAVRHPERIGRIIVLNTGAFTLPAGKRMPWQLRVARAPLLGAMLVRGMSAFSKGAVRDCVMTPMPREVAKAYLQPYDSWHNRLAVHRFIQDIPLTPGDRAFETVANTEKHLALFRDVPMLICWGIRDFVFDEHFLNRWIELFPSAEVHRFEQAGHYVLEDAGDRIVPLVNTFLNGHSLA